MSKTSFRPRQLDALKPMPIYMAEEVPDLPQYSAINRAVHPMPSGMHKEEESVSFPCENFEHDAAAMLPWGFPTVPARVQHRCREQYTLNDVYPFFKQWTIINNHPLDHLDFLVIFGIISGR